MVEGNGEHNPTGPQQQEPIDESAFPPEYFWAFLTLMLYKTGGVCTLSVDILEKFELADAPEIFYSEELKAWQMKLKDKDMPKKKSLIKVPKGIAKKMFKEHLS
jgi:hypothetical protein